jgi:hypothetical protein
MVLHAGFQKPVETGRFSQKPGKVIRPDFTGQLVFGKKTNICTVEGFLLVFQSGFCETGLFGFLTLSEWTFLNFELISKYFFNFSPK